MVNNIINTSLPVVCTNYQPKLSNYIQKRCIASGSGTSQGKALRPPLPDSTGIRNVGLCEGRTTGEPGEKTLTARRQPTTNSTNDKLNPHMTPGPVFNSVHAGVRQALLPLCRSCPLPLANSKESYFKDVRAHCYCASQCARSTSCISSARTELKLNKI